MLARLAVAACAAGLLLAAGCGPAKLDIARKLDLDAGDAKALDLDAQPKPQRLTVEYASTAGDVTVYVFKEADAKGEDGLLNAEKNKDKALAVKSGKGETFAVDVSAGTALRVVVSSPKKTEVTVKLTNRK